MKTDFIIDYLSVIGKMSDEVFFVKYSQVNRVDIDDLKEWATEVNSMVDVLYKAISNVYQSGRIPNKELILKKINIEGGLAKDRLYQYASWCVSKG